jgi:hypothetical protein
MPEIKQNGVFSLDYKRIDNIVQIGCGGTGGYVQYFLSRLLYSMELNWRYINYTLCDGDKVESANLGRQNFIKSDLDKNKADVLAYRYGNVYDIAIDYVDNYIEDLDALLKLLRRSPHGSNIPVLIGCVDNNRSRQLFHEAFEKLDSIIYIDSGNDEVSGQVVCGIKYNKQVLLPPVGTLFPDLLNDKDTIFKSQEGCGERAVSEPQNLATNSMAGQIVFSYINNLLTKKELQVYMTTFDSETAQASSKYIEDYIAMQNQVALA